MPFVSSSVLAPSSLEGYECSQWLTVDLMFHLLFRMMMLRDSYGPNRGLIFRPVGSFLLTASNN